MFLCELDSVVGDGDHGTTIRRGVKAAQEKIETEKPDKVDKLLAAYALGYGFKYGWRFWPNLF